MRGSPRSGDVVDDARPRFEGGFGGRGAVSVYRDDGVGPLGQYLLDDRDDPANLFFLWDGVRAGAGGLATDVYYLRTLVQHGRSTGGGFPRVEKVATV
jgi:hypothetical protein